MLRRSTGDRTVAWVEQVHGNRVVVVESAAERMGQEADALVTSRRDVALVVRTADCAPMALAAPEGLVGVAHGGWRGLAAGILTTTCRTLRDLGASKIHLALGPCIRPCCYAFGEADLDRVAASLGDGVRSIDREGRPALDLAAAVRSAAEVAGAELVHEDPRCTACTTSGGRPVFWSHRRRADRERQGVLAWLN